ncbi:MAG: GNAT family N-acetyltransferase [Candidatus Cardinium sp.]|nr:GNAT family N-acetyltransferase [Candidatus Cardinium sp.]
MRTSKHSISRSVMVGMLLFIGGCNKFTTSMLHSDTQEAGSVENSLIQNVPSKTAIKVLDLASVSHDQRETYLKQIAQWYYDEWGKYCASDKPNVQSFQIEKSELVANQLPVTLIACEDTPPTDKLIAVVRLKKDAIEDANKEKIFPEGTYALSGLYVAKHYRGKNIGKTLVAQALTIAIKQYHAEALGFFSHSKKAQNLYEHYGIPLCGRRKIHDKEAAVYFMDNPALLLQKLGMPPYEKGT